MFAQLAPLHVASASIVLTASPAKQAICFPQAYAAQSALLPITSTHR